MEVVYSAIQWVASFKVVPPNVFPLKTYFLGLGWGLGVSEWSETLVFYSWSALKFVSTTQDKMMQTSESADEGLDLDPYRGNYQIKNCMKSFSILSAADISQEQHYIKNGKKNCY